MQLNYNSKMDIKKDIRNDLMKRQEFVIKIESGKGLNYNEVRKLIAEKNKKPEENIDIRKIKGSFGKNVFTIDVYVYDSKENLDNMKKLEMTAKERKENSKNEERPKEEKKENKEESVKEEKSKEA